jgi:hypothetical protein
VRVGPQCPTLLPSLAASRGEDLRHQQFGRGSYAVVPSANIKYRLIEQNRALSSRRRITGIFSFLQEQASGRSVWRGW